MATPTGRIEPSAVFDAELAEKMFHTGTDDLIAMYRKGGDAQIKAALELGRRAVNKSAKKAKKSA